MPKTSKEFTPDDYKHVRANFEQYDPAYIGHIAFCASFGGKWFGGYPRNNNEYRADRISEVYRHAVKQSKMLQGKNITWLNCDYRDVDIPEGSVIYCDIPYKHTTQYKKSNFNHDEFFTWCKTQVGKTLYVSEYNINDEMFEEVWSAPIRVQMKVDDNSTIVVEKLYKLRN